MGSDYDNSKNSFYRDRERDYDKQRAHRSYSNNRRSSDYRTDYSHANDSHDSGERKNYRSTNEYNYKQDKYRERRSRSRSTERLNKEYDNRNYNDCEDANRDRERNNYHERKDDKKEEPNNTLMVRNLPPHATDKDIAIEINKLGFYPKDIRLMKNRDTGQSRGFAFIEFLTLEQAIQLKETLKDVILIANEYECTLHYSFPKESVGNNNSLDKNVLKTDWNCPKCSINNFKRRDECFKCGSHRDAIIEPNEVIQLPTSVLILRNLSFLTTEEKILATIEAITPLPFKAFRMMSDSIYPQTNMCSLELHSVAEAIEMMSILNSLPSGLILDDSIISVSYGKRFEMPVIHNPSIQSQQAAAAALAAAQWRNRDETNCSSVRSQVPQKVNVKGVQHAKYNPPDYNSFNYDATSGYYYDSITGFHYDATSGYFYNSQTQKYMYYDTTNNIYVTVDSSGQATSSGLVKTINSPEATTSKQEANKTHSDNSTTDKAKMAKKIAKDMEKWAKTLNQKKEVIKASAQHFEPIVTESDVPSNEQNSSEIRINVFEKQSSPVVEPKDPFEIINEEEQRLTDLARLACLLCKRQFVTLDLLNKHQQISELHKTNLTTLREKILSEEQLEHVAKVERELAYRDRAKERRDKFGFDDTSEYPKRKYENSNEHSIPTSSSNSISLPISDSNIGSKMLKAMGWSEGKGLGKSNQGMSGIIEAAPRKEGLGLGVKDSSLSASNRKESYKDAVRRTALQRFKELSEG